MARRSKNMEVTVEAIGADRIARDYGQVADRLQDARPAFEQVLHVLEEGEAQHFNRLAGRQPDYVRTGALRASLTQPNALGAIREAHGSGLVFGTSVFYATFLHARRTSRATGEVSLRKGKSAVLVLQAKAKRRASQILLDYATQPFGEGDTPSADPLAAHRI